MTSLYLLRNLAICLFLAVATHLVAEEVTNESMTPTDRILDTIKYLADDEREGRGVGTEGIEEAAKFLADQFRDLGLKTDLYESGPFQNFTTRTGVSRGEDDHTTLEFVGPVDDEEASPVVSLKLDDDFTSLAIGGSGEFDGKLVFVGYGITAEDLEYDDYADVDVEGKVVVVLRKEPQQTDADSKFDGTDNTQHAQFRTKIRNAQKHGAAAVLLVNDPLTLRNQQARMRQGANARWRRLLRRTNQLKSTEDSEERDAEQWNASIDALTKEIEDLRDSYAEIENENYDPIMGFRDIGSRSFGDLPVFFVSRSKVDRLLKDSIDTPLVDLEAAIDESGEPQSQPLNGWRAVGASNVVAKEAQLRNVIAVLPGDGPLADETIVVGAHYDHVGMGGPNSLAPWTTEVHNGADDNASGTTALVEMATMLSQRDKRPRRRIVFIAFSGEESGLLGSAHYVKEPRFPLEKTIAMLNLDMVGRLKNNRLSIEGTGTAEEFDGLVSQINDRHGFKLRKKASGFGASDHTSFYTKKIPVLFLFTGLHKDYHRPGDDWEKINIEGIKRVVDYGIDIIDAWDKNDEPPTYAATGRGLMGSLATSNRVVIGVMIDRNSQEEGVLVGDVAPEGPAEKAGIRSGDLIFQINEKSIEDLGDLRAVLAEFKDGDKVMVNLKRDGEQKALEVQLQKAG